MPRSPNHRARRRDGPTRRSAWPAARVTFLVAFSGALLALAPLGSSTAGAQEVLDAVATGNGTCKAFSAQDDDGFTTFENIVTQMCDALFVSGDRFAQAISRVSALFYEEPIVDVLALAEQENGVRPQVIATSSALLSYNSDIEFIAAPPFVSPAWPLLLTAPWSMSDFGSNGSITAEVRLTVFDDDGAVFFADVMQFGVDPSQGQWTLQSDAEVNAPFTIQIEATCAAVAPDDGLAQCQAILDPLIEFDQPTFDATWGASSFILTDYLTIVRSPNLVPEPGLGAMLAAGVLALAALRRRHQSV